jgi:ribose transport system permease protein
VILAMAAILPLAAGEFDLSIGATLGFSAILSITLSNAGVQLPVVIALTVIAGLVVGAVNAGLVVGIGVNAFIATLAASTVLAGINLFITQGTLLTLDSASFGALTTIKVADVQIVLGYAVVASLVLYYLLEKTPFGRYLRATGMGRDAARLSGVRVNRYLAAAFVAAGGLAALGGVLLASRSGSAPPTIGPEFLLPAYAAAFLGATTIKPGYFNVWGTVVGVLLLAVGSNGLTLLGAQTWVTNVFNGVALMIAVSVSMLVGRYRSKSSR